MERIHDLDTNKRDRLYKYAENVLTAKLDGNAKNLLWFYAYVYNWTENRRSFYTEETICAYTGMALSTFQTKKKYLEKLEWIDCIKTGLKDPVLVKPTIGVDDPAYEQMCWAKWHPSNKHTMSLKELSHLSDEELISIARENGFLEEKSREAGEAGEEVETFYHPTAPTTDIW